MKILIVDDEAEYRGYLGDLLTEWGHETWVAVDGEEALTLLDEGISPDVILSDLMMPRMDGFALLRRLKSEDRLPPTILLTAFGSLETAIATIHDLGGFWFIEKPVDTEALRMLVTRAGMQSNLARENRELKRELSYRGVLGNLVGNSRRMQEVFAIIRQVAPTNAAVLITGESGTGKELVARAIHSHSKRSSGPFYAINCAAMPETLIESEIFGHEKGSFTGAVDRRAGALEAAQGGTLFLDELCEMPMTMQAKFLRVLEDLHFRRLGGKQELKADIRIVTATNREPIKAIRDGRLREDLYYRLNVFHVMLPPLRERKDDIPLIVEALIHNLNSKHGTRVTGCGPGFLHLLEQQNWDGNVRELRNIIERAVILAGSGLLYPAHIPVGWSGTPIHGTAPTAPPSAALPATSHKTPTLDIEVGMTIEEAERRLIEATLKENGNNKTKAAAVLGISTKTLHVKLRQYRDELSTVEVGAGDE